MTAEVIAMSTDNSSDKMTRVNAGERLLAVQPRLLTKPEATDYLRGIPPEAIGVRPIPANCRKTRYDQKQLDFALDQMAGIRPQQRQTGRTLSADAALDEWASG